MRMPIYEYRCEHCGDFEEMQRITDPPLARCPKCRRKVKRLISHTSFQLKGTGWYVTDYARSGGANGGKAGEGASTEKSDAKADAKSNGKSETKADKASGSTSEKSAS
jgi:putative FmdB family regulatory protein